MQNFLKMLKKAYKDMDKVLLVIVILLFIFGLGNILTASSREAVVNGGVSMTYYFKKQLIVILVSFAIAQIVLLLPTKRYYDLMKPAFLIFNGLLLWLVLFGEEIKGAKNWILIPGLGMSFQPSEVMKIIVLCSLALLFEKFYRHLKNPKSNKINIYVIIVLCVLIPMALIFLQKDFGTMLILLIISFILFMTSPILVQDKFKIMGYVCIILAASCLVIYLAKGYVLSGAQLARFKNFWRPCDTYETGGYQVCNCFIAINNGGFLGVGPGNSTQKYSFIPEPHTDSVFAIFAEEYGVLWSTFLFLAYIIIIKRIINISSNATTIRGRYIALGIATYITFHIVVNLGGIFGLIPLTGIPLPFLSYGGTYAITLIIAIAIVERIHIETKNAQIKL